MTSPTCGAYSPALPIRVPNAARAFLCARGMRVVRRGFVLDGAGEGDLNQ